VIKYILIECRRDVPVLVNIGGRLRNWFLDSALCSTGCEGCMLDIRLAFAEADNLAHVINILFCILCLYD
jgi:hypothetical protein